MTVCKKETRKQTKAQHSFIAFRGKTDNKTERDNSRDAFHSDRVGPIKGSKDNGLTWNPVAYEIKLPETFFYYLKSFLTKTVRNEETFLENSKTNLADVLIMGKCVSCAAAIVSLYSIRPQQSEEENFSFRYEWKKESEWEENSASHPRCSTQ